MATKNRVLLLAGTKKGGFVFESDSTRRKWKLRAHHFQSYETYHLVAAGEGKPVLYAGVNTWTWGPVVQKSTDLGKTWRKAKSHPRFPEDNKSKLKVSRIWNLQPYKEALYVGVEPAALFVSQDGGDSWHDFEGLNYHETRENWHPGGGGLCLHTIVIHPRNGKKIRVGISAVGVLGSDDGGENWRFMNKNIRADFLPDKYPVFGQCVHKIDNHSERPDALYLQNHGGVYTSKDFGETWVDIGKGLVSDFGFPIKVHSDKPDTVYVVPMNGDPRLPPGGQPQVWRSEDGGRSWRKFVKGLPKRSYFTVLREALAVDSADPVGIYFGTTTGQLFYSRDEGESWEKMAEYLPSIYSVNCVTL